MELIKILLLAEYEEPYRLVLDTLNSRGFVAVRARSGGEALDFVKIIRPDILLCDLPPEKLQTQTVLNAINYNDNGVPLIMILDAAHLDDGLIGLETGAADFIKKPLSTEELFLRIMFVLRRGGKAYNNIEINVRNEYQAGRFTLDPERLALKEGTLLMRISQREADLLKLLIEHKFQVVDMRRAIKTLWPGKNVVDTRSLHVYIARLRKYLRSDKNVRILNVRARGYRLIE